MWICFGSSRDFVRLTICLGVMVFSPVWFLLDSGIVYSTKKHVEGLGRPFEVRAVGGWFHDYLRGYAGFGVALSFILILVEYFTINIEGSLLSQIPDILWMFGLPLFIALTVIPALIILNITRDHRIRYIRKVASAIGITEKVIVSYQRYEVEEKPNGNDPYSSVKAETGNSSD